LIYHYKSHLIIYNSVITHIKSAYYAFIHTSHVIHLTANKKKYFKRFKICTLQYYVITNLKKCIIFGDFAVKAVQSKNIRSEM